MELEWEIVEKSMESKSIDQCRNTWNEGIKRNELKLD